MNDTSIWRVRGAPLLPPESSGPLDGLGVAVKDVFAVGGFPLGAGNPRWLDQAPAEAADAWAVAALRRAGAAVNGIAQTDELAFSLSGANTHYGTPPNPAAPALVTGGSSNGPAAAVACGEADIGLGTDTAGSVRVPASVCGLYGLRPTHGAVPADGVLHLAPSFDTVGWLAADPSVLRAVGSVLLPPQAPNPPRRLMSFHTPNDLVFHLSAPLNAEPCPVPSLASLPGLDDITALLTAFRTVQAAEAWQVHGRWIAANPGALHPDVEARFRAGADVGPDTRRRAAEVIGAYRARTLDVLGEDTWLVLPAAAGPGHPRDASRAEMDAWRQATLRYTVIASAFGLPSCVVPDRTPTGTGPASTGPVGMGPTGTGPVGTALAGPPGADRALLEAAQLIAAAETSPG